MATNTAGTTARELTTQQIHYLRKALAYTDGNSAAVTVGYIPAGSLILPQLSGIFSLIAYNSGTNNNYTIGTAASATAFIGATAFPAAGAFTLITGTGTGLRVTIDTQIIVTNALTGTQATTGSSLAVFAYIPNIG